MAPALRANGLQRARVSLSVQTASPWLETQLRFCFVGPGPDGRREEESFATAETSSLHVKEETIFWIFP